MQYKRNVKIIIDKRKLDILLRLNCDKKILYNTIVYNKIEKTGDELIDECLETLADIKEFKNWGGNHNPTGKNQYTKKIGQDFGQLDPQVEGQEVGQLVDKDIDIDKDINTNTINTTNNITNNINNINNQLKRKKDYFLDKAVYKCFEIYETYCKNLLPLTFEKRSKDIKEKLNQLLIEIDYKLDDFKCICIKANEIEFICDNKIDFKSLLNNYIGILNGKYKTNKKSVNDYNY